METFKIPTKTNLGREIGFSVTFRQNDSREQVAKRLEVKFKKRKGQLPQIELDRPDTKKENAKLVRAVG